MLHVTNLNYDTFAQTFDISAAIGVDRYTYEQYMKAVIPLFHALMFISEEEQVNGLTYIIDFGGSTMKFLKWMGFDKIKQMADFINVSFIFFFSLSYDVMSGSDITPSIKVCKPLGYKFSGNVVTSITTLRT